MPCSKYLSGWSIRKTKPILGVQVPVAHAHRTDGHLSGSQAGRSEVREQDAQLENDASHKALEFCFSAWGHFPRVQDVRGHLTPAAENCWLKLRSN